MKVKYKIIITIIIFVLLGLMTYAFIGNATCHKLVVVNTRVANMPDFVYNVWPLPASRISSICYLKSFSNTPFQIQQRGISIEIHPASIINLEISQQSDKDQSFKDRVSLYVDGGLVSNKSRSIFDNLLGIGIVQNGKQYLVPDISEEYIFSWTPFLLPGNHEAKVIILTKSGKILEYHWNFLVW